MRLRHGRRRSHVCPTTDGSQHWLPRPEWREVLDHHRGRSPPDHLAPGRLLTWSRPGPPGSGLFHSRTSQKRPVSYPSPPLNRRSCGCLEAKFSGPDPRNPTKQPPTPIRWHWGAFLRTPPQAIQEARIAAGMPARTSTRSGFLAQFRGRARESGATQDVLCRWTVLFSTLTGDTDRAKIEELGSGQATGWLHMPGESVHDDEDRCRR